MTADDEPIYWSDDTLLKMSFDGNELIQFRPSVQNMYPTLSTTALKVPLLFNISYLCEVGFSER